MAPIAWKVAPLCGWSSILVTKCDEEAKKQFQKDVVIKPRWEYYTDTSASNVCNGDIKIKALLDALSKIDKTYNRSPGQRTFHKAFIAATLKKIYGSDISQNISRLLKEFDLTEIRSDIIITTPRRFGKTWAVAQFVAAYIVTQPDAEVNIYSTGRRASRKLLVLVAKFVELLVGTGVIKVFNQETLEISGTGASYSKCNSYPSKAQVRNKKIIFKL